MAIAKRPSPNETLAVRVEKYFPSKEILEAYPSPDPLSIQRREIFEKTLPGANFSLVYSHLENRLLIVPTWHPLNTTPIPTHGGDYGSGVFEGHSLEPVVRNGELTGANLILHEARMRRLERSLASRDFSLPVPIEEFSQGVKDLVSIIGDSVLISRQGIPCRAYVRPEARPGMGGFGLGVRKEHLIDAGVVAWNWPYYFKDPERAYQGSGLVLAAFPEQRLAKIKGKHASNYGEAGVIGNRARRMEGVDEALYFGPYLVRPRTRRKEQINLDVGGQAHELLKFGVLADGPGEEIFAITSGGEIWYPPMDVNRLGGTTLDYLVKHIAPALIIPTDERPFSLFDVKTGLIRSLLFAGNAARLAPIGEIRMYKGISEEPLDTLKLEISPLARELVSRYEAEVTAQIAPSHSSLLTPVDICEGFKARRKLLDIYMPWFL